MTTVVTTAASIVGGSNDLVPEILVYLPVKTLLRLKLVCKKWKLIISDTQFAVNHFRKTHNSSVSPTGGLFVYHRSKSEQRHEIVSLPLFGNPPGSVPPLTLPHKLPLDFPYTKIKFQSCNGLLLCIFSGRGSDGINASLCAVCNPTFGDFKFLPNPPVLGTDHRYDGYTLVFNPFESHHYSVVAIRRTCSDVPKLGAGELYSFSSETKRWEFRHMIDGVEMKPSAHRGWYWNDTVYWIGEKLIHYYKVNSQEFGSLDLPPEITRVYTGVWTAECFAGGRFYIVERDWNDGDFKIFEFDNVSMKWLNPHIDLLNSDHFGTKPIPLAVARGKEKRDFVFVFAANPAILPDLPDTLMIYDLVMHKLVEKHALKSIFYAYSCDYVPSLIPV